MYNSFHYLVTMDAQCVHAWLKTALAAHRRRLKPVSNEEAGEADKCAIEKSNAIVERIRHNAYNGNNARLAVELEAQLLNIFEFFNMYSSRNFAKDMIESLKRTAYAYRSLGMGYQSSLALATAASRISIGSFKLSSVGTMNNFDLSDYKSATVLFNQADQTRRALERMVVDRGVDDSQRVGSGSDPDRLWPMTALWVENWLAAVVESKDALHDNKAIFVDGMMDKQQVDLACRFTIDNHPMMRLKSDIADGFDYNIRYTYSFPLIQDIMVACGEYSLAHFDTVYQTWFVFLFSNEVVTRCCFL